MEISTYMSKHNSIPISEFTKSLHQEVTPELPDETKVEAVEEVVKVPEEIVEETPKVVPKIAPKLRRDRNESAFDAINVQLSIFKKAPIGSSEKANALYSILKLVLRMPKKQVLDTIFDFFVTNKKAEFIQPLNALQGTQDLSPAENVKLRVFYELMMKLASGNANRSNTNLEMIRTIFGSDDLTTWASIKINRTYNR